MKTHRYRAVSACLAVLLLAAVSSAGQKVKPTTGDIKGKVRVDSGATQNGVQVLVRRGEEEIARAETNGRGEFQVDGVAPGRYSLVFRKTGLRTAEIKDFEVSAGKVRSLSDRVFLPADEGALAFVKGSVFTQAGRVVPGARVELARVEADGTVKKLDGRVTTESGSFSFRLTPGAARYRVTARAEGMEAASKDVDVEGAMIYRVALSLKPAAP